MAHSEEVTEDSIKGRIKESNKGGERREGLPDPMSLVAQGT